LQGAASVAGLMITTEAMIAERPTGREPPKLPGHDHDHLHDMEF
jgi:chaperonin GroEL